MNSNPHLSTGKLLTAHDVLVRLRVNATKLTNLVKHIKNSQRLLAIFRKLQGEGGEATTSLKLPVKTRWGSVIHCMQSIQDNKHTLQKLAIDEEAKAGLDRSVKNTLLTEVFWDNL